MRLVLGHEAFVDLDLAALCERARVAGFEAITLGVPFLDGPDGSRIARAIRAALEAGIAIAGIFRPLTAAECAVLAGVDELRRRRLGNRLAALVEAAGELGGSWLAVTTPVGHDLPPGEEATVLARILRELRRVAEQAARHRLRLLVSGSGELDREALAELGAMARALDSADVMVDLTIAGDDLLDGLAAATPAAVRLAELPVDRLARLLAVLGEDFAGDLVIDPVHARRHPELVAARLAGLVHGLRERG